MRVFIVSASHVVKRKRMTGGYRQKAGSHNGDVAGGRGERWGVEDGREEGDAQKRRLEGRKRSRGLIDSCDALSDGSLFFGSSSK